MLVATPSGHRHPSTLLRLLLGIGMALMCLVLPLEAQGKPQRPSTSQVTRQARKARAAARQAPRQSRRRRSQVLIGPRGEVLGRLDRIQQALGGTLGATAGPQVGIGPTMHSGVFEITLSGTVTGTGWEESFLLGIPMGALVPRAPLLVAFHSYSRTPQEILQDTDYFSEAMARGWYVLAPLGAHKFGFGLDYSQRNIRAAVEWAMGQVPVDPERIYGVGFSMGGGVALNYAARYLDPTGPMMAAVVDHTGTVSIRDEYANAVDTSLFENPLMFGGSPSQVPFAYQQASSIDMDPLTAVVDPDADLLRNLGHVHLRIWNVDQDPVTYLLAQTLALGSHALGLGLTPLIETGPGSSHSWDSLDEAAVLDWLDPLRLYIPVPGDQVDVLAHEDGRYFHFELTQDAGGAFSPFRWHCDTISNHLTIDRIGNVERLRFEMDEVGLLQGQLFEVELGSDDGDGLRVEIGGLPAAPASVQRNGQASGNWSYDVTTGLLVIDEAGSSTPGIWSILP